MDEPMHVGNRRLLLLRKRGRFEDLVQHHDLRYEKSATERRNLERYCDGVQPQGPAAWRVGEALGFADRHVTPLFPGCGGLLALYWFARFDDFAGIVACIDRKSFTPYAARFRSMLLCLDDTAIDREFDDHRIPNDHNIFDGRADAKMLSHADFLGVGVDSTPEQLEVEALELNRRYAAMMEWDYDTDLAEVLEEARKTWFSIKHGDTGGRRTVELMLRKPAPLRYAFALSKSAQLSDEQRIEAMVEHYLVWLRAVMKPYDTESVLMFTRPDGDPDEATRSELAERFAQFEEFSEELSAD